MHLFFFITDDGDCFFRGFTSGFAVVWGYTLYKEGFKCFEWLNFFPCVLHTCLQNFRKIRRQTLELWPFENGWVNFSNLKSELQSEKEKVCGH